MLLSLVYTELADSLRRRRAGGRRDRLGGLIHEY